MIFLRCSVAMARVWVRERREEFEKTTVRLETGSRTARAERPEQEAAADALVEREAEETEGREGGKRRGEEERTRARGAGARQRRAVAARCRRGFMSISRKLRLGTKLEQQELRASGVPEEAARVEGAAVESGQARPYGRSRRGRGGRDEGGGSGQQEQQQDGRRHSRAEGRPLKKRPSLLRCSAGGVPQRPPKPDVIACPLPLVLAAAQHISRPGTSACDAHRCTGRSLQLDSSSGPSLPLHLISPRPSGRAVCCPSRRRSTLVPSTIYGYLGISGSDRFATGPRSAQLSSEDPSVPTLSAGKITAHF